ncbi:MAG: hypothetical protein Q8P58_00605 [Candidatus Adlerbacteria bacterium]|nr:hypothetical protein [Candidatus Adlerbacteria bacterium]MDZ4226245.1 hypothetical protein [Patescibacteria group bacterium]
MRNARAIAITYTSRLNHIAALLAAVVACSLLLYGLFLLQAVGHTAKRAEAGRETKALTSELSGMQARYLAYTREVSPERAAELGFVKPTEVSTVFASTPRPLSLRGQ